MRKLLQNLFLGLAVAAMALSCGYAVASTEGDDQPPPSLSELQNLPKENSLTGEDSGLPLDIRRDAIKEAAVSLGARGGLAWQSFAIRKQLEHRARYLDKVFNFRQLFDFRAVRPVD